MSAPSASRAFERPSPRLREVLTPEGVPLRFTVAAGGDRAAAFLLDLLAVVGLGLALLVLASLVTLATGDEWLLSFLLLALFFLRNFYFTWFELRWRGATPGKRRLRLRVIDRGGGVLSAEAVVVRNLMREVEVFLPLVAAVDPGLMLPGAPAWAQLASIAWLFVFAALPLFNRDRLRIGDLVAGTLVVEAPEVTLLEDVGRAPAPRAAGVTFTPAQLDLYGTYELQVLEQLLRDGRTEPLRVAARKIRDKIGWTGPSVPAREFLTAFYRAQRARLERQLLLGKARERKREGRLGDGP